ncbi:hypothetical protein GIB67_001136 [Kingdonia uniflora]|uniref:Uncharacterized protein n=1 Tax=Kingdonia uniflora TaxID=39325 RepID=A0A7J7N4K9_9MAGN|nr:hypothetical protein GIB67_001136 [Kingdonia uniflora]
MEGELGICNFPEMGGDNISNREKGEVFFNKKRNISPRRDLLKALNSQSTMKTDWKKERQTYALLHYDEFSFVMVEFGLMLTKSLQESSDTHYLKHVLTGGAVFCDAEIGIGLIGFGIFFTFLGVVLFFDRGLIALGNLFFLSGIALLLGWNSTWQLFTRRTNYKGSIPFLIGLFLIFVRWPLVGIIMEVWGSFVLFRFQLWAGFYNTRFCFLIAYEEALVEDPTGQHFSGCSNSIGYLQGTREQKSNI